MNESDLLARIEQLERRVARLEAENRSLRRLRRENLRLKRENLRLRKKLGMASTLPPGTPRAFIKPEPRKRRRRPGRPPGHEGATRPVPEHVDEEVVLKPEACATGLWR